MTENPRLSANLLVILVKVLVNLLVKLTKSGLSRPPQNRGWPWGSGPGNTPGRGSYDLQRVHLQGYCTITKQPLEWDYNRESTRDPWSGLRD